MDKFKQMLTDRSNLLYVVVILIFVVFLYQIAHLTLGEGEYYRALSDSKRLRKVKVSPSRGEVKDRYGKVLAGNKTSFTIKLLKDEIPRKKRNEISLLLGLILEEEGENYTDEFPILLNRIYYKEGFGRSLQDKDADEQVMSYLLEGNILQEVINSSKVYADEDHSFTYHIGKRLLNKTYKRETDCPIVLEKKEAGWVFEYKGDDIEGRRQWLLENNIDTRLSAQEAFIEYLKQNLSLIRSLYDDPIAAQVIFDRLKERGKAEDLYLQPFAYRFDENYQSIKKTLMNQYKGISPESSAKEDFVNIAQQTIVSQLIEKTYFIKGEKEEEVALDIVGQFMSALSQANVSVPVDYAADEKGRINFFKKEKVNLEFYYDRYGEGTPISNKEIFLKLLEEHKEAVKLVFEDEDIKYIVQRLMIEAGINTQISVASWAYVPVMQKENWLKDNGCQQVLFASEVFEKLRGKYKMDDGLTPLEARLIMNMNGILSKQGYRAYEPIRVAMDVTDCTVSKIKENQRLLQGVLVEVESIRIYPYGETASHILGYMGRIAQRGEIEAYIEKGDYAPDDLIGKTGLEQKFEPLLRGRAGHKILEVDVLGNTIEVKEEQNPIKGHDIYTSADVKLQQTAEYCLKEALKQIQEGGLYQSRWGDYKYKDAFPQANCGALVAVEVKTNKVLAMVNIPSFDPNLFATGITNQDWKELNRNESSQNPLAPKPLYNIAMQTAIQPGSTFKMITALAALEAGIDPYKTVHTMGYIELGNRVFKCWKWPQGTHGNENMMHALRDSCNYYFYTIMLGKNLRNNQVMGKPLNYKNVLEMARRFGLDDPTGIEIDIPNEKKGGVPDPDLKKKMSQKGLGIYLKRNIEQFLLPGEFYTPDQIERNIEDISNWALEEEVPSRNEVMRRLESLRLVADRSVNGKNLTDIIKYDYLNDSQWKVGDSLNIAIGQGQNAYTPLQMARYVAIIANEGRFMDFSLIDHIEDAQKNVYIMKKKTEGPQIVESKHLGYVQKGMGMVSDEGTARAVFRNFPISVAAKTGSAQKDGINPETGQKYDNYGWFVAYAPYDDPEIAIAAVAFQSGSGGVIGPAVRDVMAEYLGLNENVSKYMPQGKIELQN